MGYCQTPVLGLGLGVDFTFAWDNNKNSKDMNPHLNFMKGTVEGDKEHWIVIMDRGQGIPKTLMDFDNEDEMCV